MGCAKKARGNIGERQEWRTLGTAREFFAKETLLREGRVLLSSLGEKGGSGVTNQGMP